MKNALLLYECCQGKNIKYIASRNIFALDLYTFIKNKHIGGYDDLNYLKKSGKLDKFLN